MALKSALQLLQLCDLLLPEDIPSSPSSYIEFLDAEQQLTEMPHGDLGQQKNVKSNINSWGELPAGDTACNWPLAGILSLYL